MWFQVKQKIKQKRKLKLNYPTDEAAGILPIRLCQQVKIILPPQRYFLISE